MGNGRDILNAHQSPPGEHDNPLVKWWTMVLTQKESGAHLEFPLRDGKHYVLIVRASRPLALCVFLMHEATLALMLKCDFAVWSLPIL